VAGLVTSAVMFCIVVIFVCVTQCEYGLPEYRKLPQIYAYEQRHLVKCGMQVWQLVKMWDTYVGMKVWGGG